MKNHLFQAFDRGVRSRAQLGRRQVPALHDGGIWGSKARLHRWSLNELKCFLGDTDGEGRIFFGYNPLRGGRGGSGLLLKFKIKK